MTYILNMFVLIFVVFLCGCQSTHIESLNGNAESFWSSTNYKYSINSWVGQNINQMLTHDDFSECRYTKLPMSSHINFYTIKTSVWRYADNGLNVTNDFVIHVFTDKNNKILSIAFPK